MTNPARGVTLPTPTTPAQPITLSPILMGILAQVPPQFGGPILLPEKAATYLNLGPIRNRGIEASIDHRFNTRVVGLRQLLLAGHPGDPRARTPDQIPYPVKEVGLPSEHRFNAGLGYNGKTFFGNANVNYASEALWVDVLNATYAGFTDAYTMLNATVGVKLADGKVMLSLKGINLTNETDPAAHLRRHPQAERRGRAAPLREVARRVHRGPRAGAARGRLALSGEEARAAWRQRTPAEPVAVIDIGSNSGRVMVYRHEAGGHLHILAGSRASLRLVRDLDRRAASPRRRSSGPSRRSGTSARSRRGSGVKRIVAAGTSALRDAANGPAFLRRVRRELGITIRSSPVSRRRATASWARWAACRWRTGFSSTSAAAASRWRASATGGSSGPSACRSGALRVSDAFLKSDPPSPREVRRLREHARAVLDEAGLAALGKGERLVGTGGTLRNLAKIDQRASGYPISRLHGYTLTRRRLPRSSRSPVGGG